MKKIIFLFTVVCFLLLANHVVFSNDCYFDNDGDGFGDPNIYLQATPCPSGYVEDFTDCDDTDYYINPNGYEICNFKDDDCDGLVDNGIPDEEKMKLYLDIDQDGYGRDNFVLYRCYCPDAYSIVSGDCDDNNEDIHPYAYDYNGDEVDSNCDGCDNTCGDIDGDGDLDIDDYYLFLYAYNNCLGDDHYIPEADFDEDECITINDYRILRSYI